MSGAVIDTNVFIAGLQRGDGVNREILRRCFLDELQPLMGEALYGEYQDLLGREHLFEGSSFLPPEREAFFDDFCSISKWVSIYYRWRPNLRDEGDNHIVELALSGAAEYLITWNKKDFRGGDLLLPDIHIVTPVEYLEMHRALKKSS